jgi:transcription antitermination factor NusG
MAKAPEAKAAKIEKDSKVSILKGEHEGARGEIKHIRAHTGQAHVELESGKVVVVPLESVAAA